MNCPNCNSGTLPVSINNPNLGRIITVEQCQKCGGIWCHRYELYQIPPDKVQGTFKSELITSNQQPINPHLICPQDSQPLEKLIDINIPTNLHIFRCHHCEGVWIGLRDFIQYKTNLVSGGQKTPVYDDTVVDQDRIRNTGTYKIIYSIGNHLLPNYFSYFDKPDSHPEFVLNNSEVDLIKSVPPDKKLAIYQTLADQFNQKITTENQFIDITLNLISFIGGLLR